MDNREMKIGTEQNQINHIYLQAGKDKKLQKLYFRYNDGYVELFEVAATDKSEEEKKKEINDMFKAMGVSKIPGRDYSVALASDKIFADLDKTLAKQEKAKESEYDLELDLGDTPVKNVRVNKQKFEEAEFELDDEKVISWPHVVVAGGIAALAIAIGACGIANIKNSKSDESSATMATSETAIESEIINDNDISLPSMEGQNFEYYVTYAPESDQKATMVKYHDYVMNFNRSEDWMYQELTPEMIEELAKMSITIDGNEAIFGFTAEEINALNLVFGTHTNEEYAKLMNGNYIDVTKIMSSAESEMNQAIRKVIVYYLNSDNAHIGIENVVSFTEDEKEQIKKFEDMLQEYKDLLKEEKYKEAEAKMKEIKQVTLEYAHAQDTEVNNAKPYILRTLVPVYSVYATSYQYKDVITLNLYDNQNNDYTTKEIKTWLFDEITMRDLVEGYEECKDENGVVYQDGFSEIEFLNSYSIDSNRYSLVISDNGVSIADTYVGGLENKLSGANDYMEKLRTENSATDAYVAASVEGADISNNSELDTLTSASYNQEVILEMIDNELVNENKYPKNINFFTSIYSKFTKQIIAFKDALYGSMSGSKSSSGKNEEKVVKTTPGKTTYIPGTTQTITWTETWTETYTETRTERQKVSDEEVAQEDAANRKKAQEEASKTTVTDGATGKEKDTTYQDIYNKSVNDKTNGKTNLDTNLDNDDKTHSNDPLVQQVEKWADEDAKQIEEEHEKASEGAKETKVDENGNTHYISGGDEHIEEEYKNADTVSEEEAEAYNRQLQQQSQQPAQETQQPAQPSTDSNNAGSGEYTNTDPTNTSTFAPVVEENPGVDVNASFYAAPAANTNAFEGFTSSEPAVSESFAPAYEEEIDAIIDSMANEAAPAAEASEGMSR